MRIAVLMGAFAAMARAFPYPQEQEIPIEASKEPVFPTATVPILVTTSLNIPVTGTPASPSSLLNSEFLSTTTTTTSRKNPHWEPIPIFTKQCECSLATARYPCWATDALQVSLLVLYERETVAKGQSQKGREGY